MGDDLLTLMESEFATALQRANTFAAIAETSGLDERDRWRRASEEWADSARKWQEAITIRRKETGAER
jgi:hypothetical protein